jgi:lysozyme
MKTRLVATALSASVIALASIAGFEGYRSVAYNDGAGVQTYGFGSTRRADGSPVRPGDTTDPVRAVQRLAADANHAAVTVSACVGEVPLHQYEFDAYVSLAYNIGTGAFCDSTLVKKLKQIPPDYRGACEQILRWNRVAGEVWPGLTARREVEYRMCLGQS